jgi:hypothetical protein
MIAHPEVKLCRERLTDRDLIDDGRIGGTTRHDSGAIHDRAKASIKSCGNCFELWGAREHDSTRVQAREGLDTLDATKRTQLRGSRVADGQLEIRSPARRVEPCKRGLRPPRAGNSREHDNTNYPDQHCEHHDASPTPSDLEPRQHPHRAHVIRPPASATSRSNRRLRQPANSTTSTVKIPFEANQRLTARWKTPKLGVW